MARGRTVQTNFAAGELSPLMHGRADISHYQGGAARLCNMVPLQHGGVRRRWGSTHVDNTNANAKCRLAPFVFNDDQTYLFAFTPGRLDIYNDADGFVHSISHANLPATEAQIRQMTWSQQGDVFLVFHKDLKPQKITRIDAITFGRTDFAFDAESNGVVRQPYHKYAAFNITLEASATSGSVTVNAKIDGGSSAIGTFTSAQVGDMLQFNGNRYLLITAFTNSHTLTCTVTGTALASAAANRNWKEPMFSTRRGWPRAGIFHEDRLWIGGGNSLPAGLAGSVAGVPFNFDDGEGSPLDDDAIVTTVGGEQVVTIKHFVSLRHLQIFTDQGAFHIPVSAGEAITPANVSFSRQVPFGVSDVRPRPFDGSTLYVQKGTNVVRDFLFADVENAYTAESISILASHLIQDPVDMDVLFGAGDDLEQYAFLINGDGTLALFHGNRAQRIAAWVGWTITGAYESVCVVDDRVYVVTARAIEGATQRHIERLLSSRYLDDGLLMTADPPASTWVGLLGHLEGLEVAGMAGDTFIGRATVSGAAVTFTKAVSSIEVGLEFEPEAKTLRVELALPDGPIGAERRRLISCSALIDTTLALVLDGQTLKVRQAGDDLSTDPTPITGWRKFWMLGWDRDGQVTLRQEDPGPLTVLALALEVSV